MQETDRRPLPDAVLFACNMNAVRSPMAESLLRHYFPNKIYVDSVGVRAGEIDPFVIAVMEEVGIDVREHTSKDFEQLEDTLFDLIVSLTPEAHHNALELTRTMAVETEYWPTQDPTIATGSREQRLESYRQVRDDLIAKIRARFGVSNTQKP